MGVPIRTSKIKNDGTATRRRFKINIRIPL